MFIPNQNCCRDTTQKVTLKDTFSEQEAFSEEEEKKIDYSGLEDEKAGSNKDIIKTVKNAQINRVHSLSQQLERKLSRQEIDEIGSFEIVEIDSCLLPWPKIAFNAAGLKNSINKKGKIVFCSEDSQTVSL